MTDAETIIARVLGEHGYEHDCRCGWFGSDPATHVAAEVARALRDAALLPEATTRDEWGVVTEHYGYPVDEEVARRWARAYGAPIGRRTRTTYADHVTEWEAVSPTPPPGSAA